MYASTFLKCVFEVLHRQDIEALKFVAYRLGQLTHYNVKCKVSFLIRRSYAVQYSGLFRRDYLKACFSDALFYRSTASQMRLLIFTVDYVQKDVISVCLIITHEPLDWFASNLYWGTRKNHKNVLNLILR